MVSKKFYLSMLLASNFCTLFGSLDLLDYEKWWQTQCCDKKKIDQFAGWIGDENELSRIQVRNYISNKNFKSLLDIPCGLCVDYHALRKSCPDLIYLGIDITSLFVERAAEYKTCCFGKNTKYTS